jgi:Zn-dependent protease/CBS domain-containing protein
MRGRGIRIGRLFGIDLLIDPSWIIIFAFMTWSLAASFAHAHPTWSVWTPLVVGAAAVVLFFASVVLHELAHSVVAIATGLKVRSITLFFFGGVSAIEQEPKRPFDEIVMALAGPLVSIGLGFWMTIAARAAMGNLAYENPAKALADLGAVPSLLAWLGPINMLVGVFNLIPAFPLDGGRVLRAGIWAATGDMRRATQWAAATGQAFAWLFIVAGIAIAFGLDLPFFGTGFGSGLWLVLIGWFLHGAATRSQEKIAIEDALAGLTAARVMRRNVPGVAPEVTIAQLVPEWFMASEERAFPVLDDDGMLLGLVCIADVRSVARDRWHEVRVRDVMTPLERLATLSPAAPAVAALELMATRDVSQIPVVEEAVGAGTGGHFAGMVERRDLVRWLELSRPGAPPRAAHA